MPVITIVIAISSHVLVSYSFINKKESVRDTDEIMRCSDWSIRRSASAT